MPQVMYLMVFRISLKETLIKSIVCQRDLKRAVAPTVGALGEATFAVNTQKEGQALAVALNKKVNAARLHGSRS